MNRMLADHPNLVSWALLAIGMVAILGWSAREVGLGPSQWFSLGVATVLLAGLCTWIISWEADDDDIVDDDDGTPAKVREDMAEGSAPVDVAEDKILDLDNHGGEEVAAGQAAQ